MKMKVTQAIFKGTTKLRTSFIFGSVLLCDFNLLRDFLLEELLFFHEHFLGFAQLLDGLSGGGRLVALFPTKHSPQETHRAADGVLLDRRRFRVVVTLWRGLLVTNQ
jgi:hypothetical protein